MSLKVPAKANAQNPDDSTVVVMNLVVLPGFQNGREKFWPKKGQFASYKEKL
jgi:hypothetical protein